jgi:ATP-binding cassette, subfamily G (WHITE), member 2
MSNESVSHSGTADDAIYQSLKQDPFTVDIEQKALDNAHLMNDTVQNFTWQGITVVVKDHKTKQPKTILENVEGSVKAGMSQY